MTEGVSELTKLNERSRTILTADRRVLPRNGRTRRLAQLVARAADGTSPASIRNVMSDLEQLGLILAPHTSAGRLPTQLGLRLFVDGLLEVGDLTARSAGRSKRISPASARRPSTKCCARPAR